MCLCGHALLTVRRCASIESKRRHLNSLRKIGGHICICVFLWFPRGSTPVGLRLRRGVGDVGHGRSGAVVGQCYLARTLRSRAAPHPLVWGAARGGRCGLKGTHGMRLALRCSRRTRPPPPAASTAHELYRARLSTSSRSDPAQCEAETRSGPRPARGAAAR